MKKYSKKNRKRNEHKIKIICFCTFRKDGYCQEVLQQSRREVKKRGLGWQL